MSRRPDGQGPVIRAVASGDVERRAEVTEDGLLIVVVQWPTEFGFPVLDLRAQVLLELSHNVVLLWLRQVAPDFPQVTVDEFHNEPSQASRLNRQ